MVLRRLVRAPHKSQIPSLLQRPTYQRPLACNWIDCFTKVIVRLPLLKKQPPKLHQQSVKKICFRGGCHHNCLKGMALTFHPLHKTVQQPFTSQWSILCHPPSIIQNDPARCFFLRSSPWLRLTPTGGAPRTGKATTEHNKIQRRWGPSPGYQESSQSPKSILTQGQEDRIWSRKNPGENPR